MYESEKPTLEYNNRLVSHRFVKTCPSFGGLRPYPYFFLIDKSEPFDV